MINPNGEDTILEEIKAINSLTDTKVIVDLRNRLQFRNVANGANREIMIAAQEYGIL